MLLICWEERLSPYRRERASFGHLITSGILGMALGSLMGADPITLGIIVGGISMAVSLYAPWSNGANSGPWSMGTAAPTGTPRPNPARPMAGQPFSDQPTIAPEARRSADAQLPPFAPRGPMGGRIRQRNSIFSYFMVALLVLVIFGSHGHGTSIPIWFLIFWAMAFFAVRKFGPGGTMYTQNARYSLDPQPFTFGGFASSVTRGVVSLIGSLILLFSLLSALGVVTNLPGLFASGTLNPDMPAQLTRNFGTADWPGMMLRVGTAASIVTGLIALFLLMMARRGLSGLHMMRAVIGVAVLYAAVIALGRALPDFADVVIGRNGNESLNWYLQHVQMPRVAWAVVEVICGYAILLWPAKRRLPQMQSAAAPSPAQPDSKEAAGK
jgi:hypothetical protein